VTLEARRDPNTLIEQLVNVQNPLHTFPRNFPVDREVANLFANFLETSLCNGLWETSNDTTQQTQRIAPTCYGLAAGNWCNGFWP